MGSDTVTIGSFVISDALFITIVSIVGPFIGSVLAIFVTQRATLAVERAKWKREAQREYREKQREALKILIDTNSAAMDDFHSDMKTLNRFLESIAEKKRSFKEIVEEFEGDTSKFKSGLDEFHIPTHLRVFVPEHVNMQILEIMTRATSASMELFKNSYDIREAHDAELIVSKMSENFKVMTKMYKELVEVQLLLQEEYRKTFD